MMDQAQKDLLAETLDQRQRDRDTLLRMLTWARDEISSLGGPKTASHLTRAVECLRHEL